jgi:RsiW-degrading membrane proteinase PrsW (M82 family)
MGDPAAFVGIPQWQSIALAVILTLFWLVWLGRDRLTSPWFWLAIVVAALLFPFSIAWVQVPLQQALNAFWTSVLDTATIQRYLLLIALPSLLVASIVQEGAKLMAAVAVLKISGQGRKPRAGLAFGAAAGAGYGGFEAFWVFNQIFGIGWSWAMVDLAGPAALLGFVERFFTVPMHISTTALAGYGYASGRTWRFYLLAVLIHTAVNFGAVLLQAGFLNMWTVEMWMAVIALLAFTVGIVLRQRAGHERQTVHL